MTNSKRNMSDVLRDIDSTKKKMKRYKALRRTLKTAMTAASTVLLTGGLTPLPVNQFAIVVAAVTVFFAGGAVLWLTFSETYGFRYTDGGMSRYDGPARIAGSGLNVFDHLDRKLGELQEELAAASTA